MNTFRDLRDIFSSIHSIAKNREIQQAQQEPNLPCLCGKNHIDLDSRDDLDSAEDFHDTDVITIINTPKGSRFQLCPACNPRINCGLCDGTGHMSFSHSTAVETEKGESIYHWETLRPNACSCMRLEIMVERLNHAKIPDKYIRADFNSIKLEHLSQEATRNKLSQNIDRVVNFCVKMCQNIKDKKDIHRKYFLTLFGPVGTGKTLLACAALKRLMMNENLTGHFVDFQYLLSELRSEYDAKKTGENILNELRNTDVLLIDEFGKGRNDKEWQLEKLDDLVNYRYNQKKITIVTTNYLPPSLKYSEKEMPISKNRDMYQNDTPINETFWQQSLVERIGMRMYERLLEVSEFVDFTNLPSYRRFLGREFLNLYTKN